MTASAGCGRSMSFGLGDPVIPRVTAVINNAVLSLCDKLEGPSIKGLNGIESVESAMATLFQDFKIALPVYCT